MSLIKKILHLPACVQVVFDFCGFATPNIQVSKEQTEHRNPAYTVSWFPQVGGFPGQELIGGPPKNPPKGVS
jgi:hypothetical protein